jgi:hypothetical protein
MISIASLNDQSVVMMNKAMKNAGFCNFTKDEKILALPYRYTFINYQYKFDQTILINILQNGFNPGIEVYNSILDHSYEKIQSMKNTQTNPITELNDTKIYVSELYCNPIILNRVMSTIKSWPRNSYEFNVAFFSYIIYQMYVAINNAESTNLSKTKTAQNTIQIYKITTPFRMNAPFIYRVDITSFLPYLTNAKIKTKLSNYKTSASTTSIDLPTALLISYYDKNPQSTAEQDAEFSNQKLLDNYFEKQSILFNVEIPRIKFNVTITNSNTIERFDKEKEIIKPKEITKEYIKYALF